MKQSQTNPRIIEDSVGNPVWAYLGEDMTDIEEFLDGVHRHDVDLLRQEIRDLEFERERLEKIAAAYKDQGGKH